jgi:hypothetical protein
VLWRISWLLVDRRVGRHAVSELPVEESPAVAASARQAARGQVIHITEGGQRIAAIVPESMVEALLAAEDAEDAAEADSAWEEPGESIPLEQIEAEFGC